MAENDIYRSTAKRLENYHLFSEATIKVVARFAQKQAAYKTYQEFFKEMGVPKPTMHITKRGSGVPVVDVPAKTSKPKGTIVMHLPMGNPLDTNQLYQVATIAGVNPEYRVISFGNPSGGKYHFKQQNLTLGQRLAIATSKNPEALVEAELDYLKTKNIFDVYQIGYSYGALKAVIESYYANKTAVKGLALIEPVAHPRGLAQLVHDFQSGFKPLGEYVNRSNIPTFLQARKDAESGSPIFSLIRPINISIALLLARTDFIPLFEKVLQKYPGIQATVAWAGKSELGNDAHMKVSMHRLVHEYKNIHPVRLAEDTHAAANDLHLHAAIIRDALL